MAIKKTEPMSDTSSAFHPQKYKNKYFFKNALNNIANTKTRKSLRGEYFLSKRSDFLRATPSQEAPSFFSFKGLAEVELTRV